MNKITITLMSLLFSNFAFAAGAHVHGAVKIEMAVEGKTLSIDIDAPAESFVGFEHAAKSAAEKKAWSEASNLWKKDLLTKLFVLDKNLGCTVTKVSFEQEEEKEKHGNKHDKHDKKESGVHSDIEA